MKYFDVNPSSQSSAFDGYHETKKSFYSLVKTWIKTISLVKPPFGFFKEIRNQFVSWAFGIDPWIFFLIFVLKWNNFINFAWQWLILFDRLKGTIAFVVS